MRPMSFMPRGSNLAVVVLSLSFGTDSLAESMYYHVTDLGTLGGPAGFARSVNNHGEVVGYLASESDPDISDRAFLWLPEPAYGLPAGMNVLPPLVEGGAAWATDINDAGLIVGLAETGATSGTGDAVRHAVVWEDGVVTDLGAPGGAAISSWASAVNEAGEVSGAWNEDPAAFELNQWFLWLPMAAHGLPAGMNDLGVTGYVTIMNESGETVGGWSTDVQSLASGKVWLPSAAYGLPAGETTLLDFAIIEDINDSGVMVGYAEPHRALRWSNGTVTDIGTLGGDYAFARAINSDGAIVGSASRGTPGFYHTYIWQDGVMTDVNTLLVPGPGWEMTDAWDINDVRQILSDARLNGERHHVLLTPFTCGNGVVEPGEGCDDGNTEPYDLCNQFCQGPGIPAVSSWGMACAALLLLTAGTLILRARSGAGRFCLQGLRRPG